MGALRSATKVETKTAKVKDYVRVRPSSISQEELFETISETESLKSDISILTAKLDGNTSLLKDIGQEEYGNLYDKNGVNPNSFMLEASNEVGDIAQVMIVPMDKYLGLKDSASVQYVIDTLGEDVIERKTTYSLNAKFVEKYFEQIEELFASCTTIPQSEIEKAFTVKEDCSIKSGTIDKMKDIPVLDEDGDPTDEVFSIKEVMSIVSPIFSMRDTKVIKS